MPLAIFVEIAYICIQTSLLVCGEADLGLIEKGAEGLK